MIAGLKPYKEYAGTDLPWLMQVPAHWRLVPNRGLVRRRKILVGERHTDYQLLSLTKQGVIVRDISTGKGKFSSDMGTSQEVRGGDLVFCLFDVPETPRTVGLSRHAGMITGAYTVFESLGRGKPEYFELFYQAMDDRKLLSPLYSGLRNTIPAARFLGTKSPLPPLEEQEAIVRFLAWANGRLERTIQSKRKVIALLNEQKQAIIHRAVTRGLNPSVPLKDSGVLWLGEIPAHWEVRKVREIAQVVNGYPFDSRLFTLDRGHALVRIRDLNKATTAVRFRGPFVEAARIQRGEVLVGMDGDFNVGTWEGDEDALLNQRMCCVRSKSCALNEYLRDALVRPLREINELTYATTVKHLASSQVERISVGVPPRAELEDLVRYMRKQHLAYGERIYRLEREITLLREYRARLVADVVTGKLDVRAAAAGLPDEAPLDDATAPPDPDYDTLDAEEFTNAEAGE